MNPETVLKTKFRFTRFRPGQRDIIACLLNGQSVIVTMPTGSGKSLCYQLPALMVKGVTLVISPLIALMKDQVDALNSLGIPATFINSTLSWGETLDRFAKIKRGEIPLVYVAPERFYSNRFVELIKSVEVSYFIVDEAHCISQWGHDFRPSYLRLKDAIYAVGNPPVGAFTATATPDVRQDIRIHLGIADATEVVTGFDRSNLKYVAISLKNDKEKEEELLRILPTIPGSGIIYVGTQKLVTRLMNTLTLERYAITGYHGGMGKDERDKAQNEWISGRIPIIVATNAFGMGIDKPDVRFVIHYSMPGTVEAYYQESGRAGRDGKTSYCVAFSSYSDTVLQEFFIDNSHPPREVILNIYDFLFSLNRQDIFLTHKEIAKQAGGGINEMMVGSVFAILERAGLVKRLRRSEHLMEIELLTKRDLPANRIRAGDVKDTTLQGKLLKEIKRQLPGPDLPTIRILPETLAQNAGLTRAQLGTTLHTLERKGFIHYTPPFRGGGVRLTSQQMSHSILPIDFDTIDKHRDYQLKQLRTMMRYFTTRQCRRKYLLGYFGEKWQKRNCRGCDICMKWTPAGKSDEKRTSIAEKKFRQSVLKKIEVKNLAMNILRFIHEWNGEFGRDMVAKTLAGSQSKRLPSRLKTGGWYGRYAHMTRKFITQIIDKLEKDRYLHRTSGLYPVLTLSQKGKGVLFGNNSLPEMNIEEMSGGHRLGEIAGSSINSGMISGKERITGLSDTVLKTWSLYEAGMSLGEMARVRELKESTIVDHLCRLTQSGKKIDVLRFISQEKIKTIQQVIYENDSLSLREIKNALSKKLAGDDEYSYNEIKLVLYCGEEVSSIK